MRNLALGALGVAVLMIAVALALREDEGAQAAESDQSGEQLVDGPGQLLSSPSQGVLLGQSRVDDEPGRIQPVEPAPSQPAEPAPTPSVPQEPAVTQPSYDPAAWDPSQGNRLDREIAAAAYLFHQGPARFHAWMTQADRGLSPAKTRLALAFAVALAGGGGDLQAVRDELADASDVTAAELGWLDVALGQRGARAIPASQRDDTALTVGMEMTVRRARAESALETREYPTAAALGSSLLLAEITAPWEADPNMLGQLTELVEEAQEHHRWNRKSEWPHRIVVVEQGDSLIAIRKRFLADPRNDGLQICTGLIDRANGLNGRYLRAGQELKVPTEPVSVLVDLSARWAFFMIGSEVVSAWQVGIGAVETPTDPGEYVVGEKTEEPTWFRPGHPEIPFGHPEHAIGTRWIGWNDDFGHTSLGFHGTNEPETVGGAVSNGCVRFRNPEVEELFEILPRGARVVVRE